MVPICFVIPYFGRWPSWFDLYLASVARNPTINWVFVTDCGAPGNVPPNVRFVSMSWRETGERLAAVCGLRHPPQNAYKLCDFKFCFGHVFSEYITGYPYWAFGDIDVVYGDLRSFLTPEILKHDLITFNQTHVAGHLTLVRNTPDVCTRYRTFLPWVRCVNDPQTYRFADENAGFYGLTNIYAVESHNTPLSPYIPWTDGRFRFPAFWYYIDGRLYTNLDGERHFMYLHFMRYKYFWRDTRRQQVVHLNQSSVSGDWTLSQGGFYPYSPGEKAQHGAAYQAPYEGPSWYGRLWEKLRENVRRR